MVYSVHPQAERALVLTGQRRHAEVDGLEWEEVVFGTGILFPFATETWPQLPR